LENFAGQRINNELSPAYSKAPTTPTNVEALKPPEPNELPVCLIISIKSMFNEYLER
jgi:hypothetical protein